MEGNEVNSLSNAVGSLFTEKSLLNSHRIASKIVEGIISSMSKPLKTYDATDIISSHSVINHAIFLRRPRFQATETRKNPENSTKPREPLIISGGSIFCSQESLAGVYESNDEETFSKPCKAIKKPSILALLPLLKNFLLF